MAAIFTDIVALCRVMATNHIRVHGMKAKNIGLYKNHWHVFDFGSFTSKGEVWMETQIAQVKYHWGSVNTGDWNNYWRPEEGFIRGALMNWLDSAANESQAPLQPLEPLLMHAAGYQYGV